MERYLRGIDAWNRGALDEWLKATVTPGWELVTGGAFPGLAPISRVTIKWAHVVTDGGGAQQIRSYATWDEALNAVGLEA